MTKPTLRLVRDEDVPAVPMTDAEEGARLEAEYRQALLLLDISGYERDHGPNAYTTYVRKHGKRPPPAEARAIGLVVGKRVKADDGRFYPKTTKAEREFERDQVRRSDEAGERLERSLRVRHAIATLAEVSVSPEKIDIFYLDEREIATKLHAAVDWLNRFAMLRQPNGQDACPEDADPGRQVGGGAP
jgi:hypothetical protein